MSNIEWTDATWNPVVGCTRASAGCDNCYAVTMSHRLEAMGRPEYKGLTVLNPRGDRHFNGTVRCLEERLSDPFHWRKPRRVFVNSMSDLFHKDVPAEFIALIFGVMAICPEHTFQVLTKRPDRMAAIVGDKDFKQLTKVQLANWLERTGIQTGGRLMAASIRGVAWPIPNVWMGTSIENQQAADGRIAHLIRCPAAVRFLSCEPLLGPVDLHDAFYRARMGPDDPYKRLFTLPVIHWVIAGGESGPRARPCEAKWVRGIVKQCVQAGVPCFVKQMGSRPFEANDLIEDRWAEHVEIADRDYEPRFQGEEVEIRLRDRKGGDPQEWPENLRRREWPRENKGTQVQEGFAT